jgi:hypothetical protein
MNTLFGGFKHRYSQEFLDKLAKDSGIEWTKVEFNTVPGESVPVSPLPPPSGVLHYMEVKYTDKDKN